VTLFDRQLANLTFSLVGPGRVGSSLAAWATAAGARRIAVAGRDSELSTLSTTGQDLLLVAVPDGALDAVAASLAKRPQAAVVLHTSGSRTARALAPLAANGSGIGSLHPLKAFPTARPDPAEAHGIFFGLDGDPPAVALGARLAAAWGAVSGEIPEDARLLYHFAASLAAGGVTTLLAAAADLAGRLRLPAGVVGGYLELARGAVESTRGAAREASDPARAITGPAARGDRATLLAQLAGLAETAPEMTSWVRGLLAETIRQRDRVGLAGLSHLELLAELEGE